jgi:hypothetical protein
VAEVCLPADDKSTQADERIRKRRDAKLITRRLERLPCWSKWGRTTHPPQAATREKMWQLPELIARRQALQGSQGRCGCWPAMHVRQGRKEP